MKRKTSNSQFIQMYTPTYDVIIPAKYAQQMFYNIKLTFILVIM